MTTLNLQVNSSGNDGSIDNSALSPQLTANLVNIGNVNGNNSSTAGFRFTSATVPQGATITSATLTLYGYSSYSTGSTISAIAACEDVDNSSAFTTSSGDFNTTNRPRTTATSASKDIKSVTAGVAYTWDISTSVQEVVDRAGWSSGNAISVFVDNDGSASNEWQDFEAYDHNSTLAAKLDITYTTGGGSQGITANLLTNTSVIPTHIVANAAPSQDVTANLLTNTSAFFSPSVEHTPTYINSSNTTGSTASTSTTISVPSGVATGDLMIATVVVELASASITPSESGWTLLSNTPLSTRTHTQNVYARLASASEPGTYTWTHSSAERVGAMIVFRNAQFPTLYNAQANNTSSASCAAPSLTLDRTNSTSLWIGTNMYGTTWTAPTNYTERLDYRTGTGTSNISISFATRSGLGTGATGTITGTSANADYSVGAHVAFGPAVSVLPASLENTSVVYSATISQGVAPQELLPSILTNNNTFYSPTITTGSVTVSPEVLTNTNTIYNHSVGAIQELVADAFTNSSVINVPKLNLNILLDLLGSSNQVYVPSTGTGNVDWNILVGDGYSDVSPRQLVRTSDNILYTIALNCDSYPDLSANGLTQTIRVHKADNSGVPGSFTRKDSSNEPASGITVAAALDSNDNIHIAWVARSSATNAAYLRYAIFDTSTDTWGSVTTIASNLNYNDTGQGDQSVAIALDANDKSHIVFLSTNGSGTLSDRRIRYTNNVSGSWAASTQLDSDISYSGNLKAWHPNIAFESNGNIIVAWEVGDFNDGQNGVIYSKHYNGSWGSSVQVSAAGDNVLVGIDQSTSLLVTPNGTMHLTYILYSATNSQKYIRYRYSTDSGSTWSGNNPTNQATHNPALLWTGSKVRIVAHGTPDGSNHGENLYYFEGDGGSASWGSWTQFVTGTNYDSSVSTRWSQFNHHYPSTVDIVYWNDAYPNVLYAGTEIFALDIGAQALTNSSVFYTPTVENGSVVIQPALVSNTSSVYNPTVTTGSVSVSPPLLENSNTIHTAIIGVGSFTIYPDVINSSETFYTHTVDRGGVSLLPDSLSNSSTVYTPTINVGAVTLDVDVLNNVNSVYSPLVNLSIEADLLSNTNTIHEANITTGAVSVSPNILTNTSTFYSALVISGGTYVAPDSIENVSTFYNPSISTGSVSIVVDLLNNNNVIYDSTVTPGSVSVSTDLISNASTIYTPEVSSGAITITPESINSSNSVYDIIVSAGAVSVSPELLENSSVIHTPAFGTNVSTDLLVNTNTVFEPSVELIISTDTINNTNAFHSPTISVGSVTIETVRVESATQFYAPYVYVGEGTTLLLDLLVNTSSFYQPILINISGRISRVKSTSRVDSVNSTAREYDVLNN